MEDTPEPILLRMTDPNSIYMAALKRFRLRTAVAVTHNDILVPYPSAAIRSRNPYPVPAWSSPHQLTIESVSGFGDAYLNAFHPHLQPAQIVQRGVEYDPFPGEVTQAPYACDNLHSVEYHPAVLQNLNSLPWRRVDLQFGGGPAGLHCHEQVVKTKKHWKAPFMNEAAAIDIVKVVCEALLVDHTLR